MYSEFSQHSNYINLPYRLAKRYRKDKAGWDLLCFAICLKLSRADSGMYLRDPKDIMKTFHCGYNKARRLMIQSTSDKRLFRYNPRTKFIVARSFEIGCDTMWSRGKHQRLFRMDDVIVITKRNDGTISHYEISSQLRDLLIKKMVRLQKPSDDLQSQQCHSETRKPLTQKFIGNCAGICQTTVSRRLRKMSARKEIAITSYPKIPICDMLTGELMNDPKGHKPFLSGYFTWIRDVNDYEILDASIYCRFKHLIYNHKKRHTDNHVIKFHWEL